MKAQHTGFTLLETLVALSILSLALLTLVKSSMQQIQTHQYLREKTIAQWIGANQLTQLRLSQVSPTLGKRSGETKMAQQTWFWHAHVQTTLNKNIRKVDIQVGLKSPNRPILAHLTGFVTSHR